MRIKTIIISALFLLFGLGLQAQNANNAWQDKLDNLQSLYQDMSSTQVSMQFITSKIETTADNVALWKSVSEFYRDDSSKDLIYVNQLIAGMEGKLSESN